jgi:hypothetical protein
MNNQGREMSKSLATYMGDKWMVWTEQPLDSVWNNCPRADVIAVAKSYRPVVIRIFEVKASRSDFQQEILTEKWRSYLPFCHYFFFAAPAGLIKIEELPKGCGLATCGPKGWSVVRTPIKRAVEISEDLFLALLMKGYQDNFERCRAAELDRLGEYPGLTEAASIYGRKLSHDLIQAPSYLKTAEEIKGQIEAVANQKFDRLGEAFWWLQREVAILLNKHKYGREAAEILKVAFALFQGTPWSVPKRLIEISERIKSQEAD